MKKTTLLIMSLACANLIVQAQNLPPITTYTIQKTSESLMIDGVLDEQSWQKVPFTENFVDLSNFNLTPVYQTKAKMLWDANHLYFAFVCEDTSIWATYVGRDKNLYYQDGVEVLIDPDGDGINYAEMGFSPNAQMYDLSMLRPYAQANGSTVYDSKWNISGMTVASTYTGTINKATGGKQWICEVSLPFTGVPASIVTKIASPQVNDTWRLNFARPDHSYLKSNPVTYYTWSYTGAIDNHIPSRFGEVMFAGNDVFTGLEKTAHVQENMKVFPNPSSGNTSFTFNASREENTSLCIYDALGQMTTSIDLTLQLGENTITWDASQTKAGFYIYTVCVRNKTLTGKFQVQ